MGIVWEGKASSTGIRVVVKEPLFNGDNDDIKLDKLRVEAEILRDLNDAWTSKPLTPVRQIMRRHVVQYIDQDASNPQTFHLIIEYIDGNTMDLSFQKTPAPESLALQYGANLLQVVQALHSEYVIHRDISPKNIILNPQRMLVLIDFGASKRGYTQIKSGGTHSPGTIIVNPGYSSRELLRGEATPRSDIFSVGAVLFFLLTARSPRGFMPDVGVVTKAPKDVNPAVSRDTSEIVRKAMAPDPDNRFDTANEMLQAFKYKSPVIPVFGRPNIVLGGVRYEVRRRLEIGRQHPCNDFCKARGFVKPPDIQINDQGRFVSGHHAVIESDGQGHFWIQDLGGLNHTAIQTAAQGRPGAFRILSAKKREALSDKDMIALAYSPTRGPYITLTFNAS